MTRHPRAAVTVLALAVTLAACGSGGSDRGADDHMGAGKGMMSDGGAMHGRGQEETSPVVAGARTIAITGNDFSFRPDAITVTAGEDVTLELTSKDVEHDIRVGSIGHIVHAARGATERGGLRIGDAGSYEFWCTIPGHRAAGMEGTITVTA